MIVCLIYIFFTCIAKSIPWPAQVMVQSAIRFVRQYADHNLDNTLLEDVDVCSARSVWYLPLSLYSNHTQ